MLISIDELKASLGRLNELINNYEELHLNMYNNLASTFYCWNDINSKKFLVLNADEKKNFNLLLQNYRSIYNVYLYVWKEYSKFGKIIYYELDNREKIYECFDSYISKLESIIYKYDNSNIIKDSSFSYKIYNERKRLYKDLEMVKSIYSDVKDFYNSINDINLEVSEKLSSIDIKNIQEIDVNDYV